MNEAKVREVLTYCYDQAHGVLTSQRTEDGDAAYDFEEALLNIESKIEEFTDDDLEDQSGRYSIYAVFPDGTRRLLQSNCLNLSQAEMRQTFWQHHYNGSGATVEIQERKT